MKLSEQITGLQEDQIFRYKGLVREFQKIQDQYFEELKEKTGIRGGREEGYLFDYAYNDGSDNDFTEYLRKLNQ